MTEPAKRQTVRKPAEKPNSRKPRGQSKKRGKISSTVLGVAIGVILAGGTLGALAYSSGCSSDSGNKAKPNPYASVEAPVVPTHPPAATANSADPKPVTVAADEPVDDKPYDGPWIGALRQQTLIYPTARFSKKWIGYVRRGGKAPVKDEPIKTDSCRQGWYPLVDGGYICGKHASLKLDDPQIRMGVREPDVNALLPYKYAYNKAHGTPLYRSVPSKDEMYEYEPYLKTKTKKAKKSKEQEVTEAKDDMTRADQPRSDENDSTSVREETDGGLGDTSEPGTDGGVDAGSKRWWQREDGKPVNVTLADLEESDGTISKRMVKGFFIAVDRTFGWNDRMWYKTTEGLVAPADRMIIPKTPSLKGLEIGQGYTQVGFIRASKAYQYKADGEGKFNRGDKIARFTAFLLTGKTELYNKHRYRETADGWWMRERDGTYTEPGKVPPEAGPKDKWIDVNLGRRTLVAFIGDKPVYAALISPGKTSSNKKRDHRTKKGTFRIREKHISTTMDGDGIAGDMPYSIQDVPYVMYYDGSYALHGAFWHHNFGYEQSHGCINLAPLDAKWVFFWATPKLPRGWHGVWSDENRPGTLVVIH